MKLDTLLRIASLALLAVVSSAARAELRPFTVGAEAFVKGQHIQGIAASEDALYVAQMSRLVKVDWKGNVLATRSVQSHTGDITWHDGELYTAVAVYPECKEGRIQVFDKDFKLLRETVIDRTIDGIAYADGVLYVGMGAKERTPSAYAMPSIVRSRTVSRKSFRSLSKTCMRPSLQSGKTATAV